MTITDPTVVAIDTPSGTFTARRWGPVDGPLVLLLHGFPRTSRLFRHLGPPLGAAGWRAVAYDQRGYSPGVRPDDVADYALEHLTGDVVAVADALGADRFDLLGHDWGGSVAWAAAARWPDRLRSLTVLSTPHPAAFGEELDEPDSEQAQRSAYMDLLRSPMAEVVFLADDAANLDSLLCGAGTTPDDVAAYRSVLAEPAGFTAALNWYRASKGRGSTGVVAVPTLHIVGDADHAFSPTAVAASADHVTGPYRLVTLEGAGHHLPEECPDRIAGALLDHLADRAERGAPATA